MTHPPSAVRFLAFAAIYLIWGSTFLGIRMALDSLPPFLLAAIRFLLAGGLLLPLGLRASSELPSWPQVRAALLTGALLFLGGNGLVCVAEQAVPSGVAALLAATIPSLVVLIPWVAGGPRPSALTGAGLALGVSGIVVLGWPGRDAASSLSLPHVGAGLVAAVCWASATLACARLPLPRANALASSLQMLAGGAVLLLASGVGGEWSRVSLASVSLVSWGAVVYLAVLGSVVAFGAYSWLVRTTNPAVVSTYAFVNPVVAVLLGWLVAGEPLSWRTLAALALVAASVATLLVSRGRSPVAPPTPAVAPSARLDRRCARAA